MKIKHITNLHKMLDDVQIAVENVCKIYSGAEERFKKMAEYQLNERKVKECFNNIYPVIDLNQIKTESQFKKRNINQNIQNQLMKNFEEGFGVMDFDIKGTLWAAYNAVTQYIDHPSDYKLGNNKLLKRIWFGEGEAIKKKAYTTAIEFLKSA
jgi:hypothetical protein